MICTWRSNTYLKRIMGNFKNMLVSGYTKQHAAMSHDYKPELTITDFCNDDEKAQFW